MNRPENHQTVSRVAANMSVPPEGSGLASARLVSIFLISERVRYGKHRQITRYSYPVTTWSSLALYMVLRILVKHSIIWTDRNF